MNDRQIDFNSLIRYIIVCLFFIFMMNMAGCNNRVDVPTQVTQCIKDSVTGECTNQVFVTIKHVVSIELPEVFTDSCKALYNETTYPDPIIRESLYQTCITNYINQVLDIIKSLNPKNINTI